MIRHLNFIDISILILIVGDLFLYSLQFLVSFVQDSFSVIPKLAKLQFPHYRFDIHKYNYNRACCKDEGNTTDHRRPNLLQFIRLMDNVAEEYQMIERDQEEDFVQVLK